VTAAKLQVMTDKEVGELWRIFSADVMPATISSHWQPQLVGLIRTLVEERAMRHFANIKLTPESDDEADWDKAMALAIGDFGIDAKDWPQ
jgi:hypothetical protein